MALKIKKNTSTHNTTAFRNRVISYLVVHYTASTNSNPGQADNVVSWFKNPKAGGSADFIVDDAQIVQYNPDILNRYCWSVGGSKSQYEPMCTSKGGKFYQKCNNRNSISIEMCSSKTNKKSLGNFDKDWYFTDEVVENTVQLVRELMKKYNIPADHVIMHHQVNGKPCPAPWVINEERLAGWKDFKNRVKGKTTTTKKNTTTTKADTTKKEETTKVEETKKVEETPKTETATKSASYKGTVTASVLNIRKEPTTSSAIVGDYKNGVTVTIKEEKDGWGKTSKGWVSLKYIKKIG